MEAILGDHDMNVMIGPIGFPKPQKEKKGRPASPYTASSCYTSLYFCDRRKHVKDAILNSSYGRNAHKNVFRSRITASGSEHTERDLQLLPQAQSQYLGLSASAVLTRGNDMD